jgi:outer membrane protein insertion porin family
MMARDLPRLVVFTRSMGGLRGILLPLLLCSAVPFSAAFAQDPPPWAGKEISAVLGTGFVLESRANHLGQSGLRAGLRLTPELRDRAYRALFGTNRFDHVEIDVKPDPRSPDDQVVVTIRVVEYAHVERVEFNGTNAFPMEEIRIKLELKGGSPLNPYHLRLDREKIRDHYLQKGYAFLHVEDRIRPGEHGGVILSWNVTEGPLVTVDRIRFSGRIGGDEGQLRQYLRSKENDRDPLFGIIPLGSNPFVESFLADDVERIKLYYRQNGWMDIHHGNRVFLKDLAFSDDKTSATITFHVDEGPRYRIRSVRFELDPASRGIFPVEEMRSWMESRPGDPYVESTAQRDVARIKERYGERAFILAEVHHQEILALNTPELDLVVSIRENDKVYVGQLLFSGNSKTREEVLRREFTRTGFVPGEEYNQRSLNRAMQRIRDRSWVDPQGGINVRTQETDDPDVRDVLVEIQEGQTGSVRFAAGYSSAFGLLGLLEYTQRNFDITDLPKSASELFDGTGFAGGGQFFRVRLQPAVQRQTYRVDFHEPWFMGYEVGLRTAAYITNTLRESYDDRRYGGEIRLDKRIEPWAFQIGFSAYNLSVEDVDTRAPKAVKELEGDNLVFSVIPAIILDTRDSFIIPTEGIRLSLSYEYTGQILQGDFDFNKLTFEAEGHIPLYTTLDRLRHVFSSSLTFGWVHGARGATSVPIVERFYAGGRDGPRGFEFRGVGPHENGDPVGGEAMVLVTLEYSYPLFTQALRGAFWYDLGNLSPRIEGLHHDKWRNVVGFGIRFMIPALGNIPVKLDFGWPLTKESDDERETVTFDIGALF